MTEHEAIRRVKKLFKLYVEDEPHSEHYLYADAVKMSEEALEKQIPKEVIFVHPLQEDDGGDYMCPTCKRGTVYNAYGDKSMYCPYCGQAIKWD